MAWQNFDIMGYAPDLPPTTPGVIFDYSPEAGNVGHVSYGIIPTVSGFVNGPFAESLSTAGGTSGAMDGDSYGGAIVYKTDGTSRIFAGTAAKLWEFDNNVTITDRSDTAYSATTTNTWSFAQMGDITFAVNLGNRLRQISTAGAFAEVGVAPVPKASIIVCCGPTSAPFIMAFDYDDGTNQYRDGWFNSGLSDASSGVGAWTTATNSCANGRLLDDIPGPITAAVAYRDGVIAFKPSGMYLGSYGTTLAGWSWQRISRDIGCLGKNCVVAVEDVIYFADEFGLWMYDGSYPKRMPGYTQAWWARQVYLNGLVNGTTKRHFAKLAYDKNRRNLWFMYPDSNNSSNAAGIVYHVDSQIWTPWRYFSNVGATVTTKDLIGFPSDSQQYGIMVTSAKKLGHVNFDVSSSKAGGVMVVSGIGSDAHRTILSSIRFNCLTDNVGNPGTPLASLTVASGPRFDPLLGAAEASTTFTGSGGNYDGHIADRWLMPVLTFSATNNVSVAAKGHKINIAPAGA